MAAVDTQELGIEIAGAIRGGLAKSYTKRGRGLGGGPLAAGPGGSCVCPSCGARVRHKTGVPCTGRKCPECGGEMTREEEKSLAPHQSDFLSGLAKSIQDEIEKAFDPVKHPRHLKGSRKGGQFRRQASEPATAHEHDTEAMDRFARHEARELKRYKPEATEEECERFGREQAEWYRHHFRVQKSISRREDVSAADRKRAVGEYGKVRYADPVNKKYPLDTEEHVRSAWSYINMPKNAAKYSAEALALIRKRIMRAAKRREIAIAEDAE